MENITIEKVRKTEEGTKEIKRCANELVENINTFILQLNQLVKIESLGNKLQGKVESIKQHIEVLDNLEEDINQTIEVVGINKDSEEYLVLDDNINRLELGTINLSLAMENALSYLDGILDTLEIYKDK